MARTPGRADTPRNEPLPSESHGRRTYLAKNYGGLSAHRLTRRNFCFQISLVVRLATDPEDSEYVGGVVVRVF